MNGKSGENPALARNCDRGRKPARSCFEQDDRPLGLEDLNRFESPGKAQASRLIRKPGDRLGE